MLKEKEPIVIAMCSDNHGADFMQVAIKSIFINNKDEDIELHLITDGFSEKTLKGLARLEKHFNRKIEVHIIDVSMFDNIPGAGDGFDFPKGTLFRFAIPRLLPTIHKVLYLDTDVIVEHSLRELWNTDLSGDAMAGVLDHGEIGRLGPHIKEIGFVEGEYVNAGILLMNLDFFRQHDVSQKCLNWLVENPDKALYCDQTALNMILRGKIMNLHDKYNVGISLYKPVTGTNKVVHTQMAEEARRDPVIIHLTGPKPWIRYGVPNFPPRKSRFDFYRQHSPVTILNHREPNVSLKLRMRRTVYCLLWRFKILKRVPTIYRNYLGLDSSIS